MPRVVALLALAAVAWLGLLVATPLLPAPVGGAVYALGSFICHQRPDRSFHLLGAQLPVCARCIGIYAGAAAGAVAAIGMRPARRPRTVVVLSAVPAVLSLLIEWAGLWRPSNSVRAATGVIAGAVVAAVLLATLHYERCARRQPTAPSPPTPI